MAIEYKTIQAKIEKVLFRKNESTWSIIKTNAGIVKGDIAWEPKEGELIQFQGKYETYNGELQFVFFKADAIIPEDPFAELKYACELTKGMGEKLAEKIWKLSGNDWKSTKAGDVPGFTEEKFNLFQDTIQLLESQKERTKAITFLLSKGCTINLAEKAFEKFSTGTIPQINENCYKLADIPHCGFKQIDTTIRYAFGIQDISESRIEAGIMYALNELLSDGSSYSTFEMLQAEAVKLLNVSSDLIMSVGRKMLQKNKLAAYPEHMAITTPAYKQYEETIWSFLKGLSYIPF